MIFFSYLVFFTITKLYIGLLISLVDIKTKFFVFALSYKNSSVRYEIR